MGGSPLWNKIFKNKSGDGDPSTRDRSSDPQIEQPYKAVPPQLAADLVIVPNRYLRRQVLRLGERFREESDGAWFLLLQASPSQGVEIRDCGSIF